MTSFVPTLVLLVGAAASGLAGSPHCVGMCGGFASAAATRGHPVAWHAGRLLIYASLGAAAAWGGAALPGPGWVGSAAAGLLLVWFTGRLAGVFPEVHLGLASRMAGWAARGLPATGGPLAAAALGATSALLPCGLLWAALAVPISAAHPGIGALSMIAFGLGTVPALGFAGALLDRLRGMSRSARQLVAAAVLAAGLWSIGTRFTLASTDPAAPPACHHDDGSP